MSAANNCGPAFPIQSFVDSRGFVIEPEEGMTLRDYFAAKAMQGMLSAAENYQTKELAKLAYDVADAMIAARGVRS